MQGRTCNLGGTGTHLALSLVGLGQVVVQIIQAGLLIGSLGHVGVDAVGTGKDPDGCDRKGRQLRNQSRDISSAEHVEGDKAHDADHKDGLDHEAGEVVEDRIIRGDIGTDFAALIIVADEEILTVQNLDVLQAVDCLQPPLGNAGLDVLVSCADAVQLWLDEFRADECHAQKNENNEQRHLPVHNQKKNPEEHGDDDFGRHLQKAENQREGLWNVAVGNPEDGRNVRAQIVFVGTVQEITQDTADHVVARIGDKAVLMVGYKKKEGILDDVDGHQGNQHGNGQPERGGQAKRVRNIPEKRVLVQIFGDGVGGCDGRYNGNDHGYTDRFQYTADENQNKDAEALALLTGIQYIGELFQNGELLGFGFGSLLIE